MEAAEARDLLFIEADDCSCMMFGEMSSCSRNYAAAQVDNGRRVFWILLNEEREEEG